MLAYLYALFRDWPADLSFKIVMETWLSAVQPWRYVDSFEHSPMSGSSDRHNNSTIANIGDTSTGSVSNGCGSDEWAAFVVDNYELYALLLLQFARRLQRIDLAVARNAQMLFRAAKVLGQRPLALYIGEAHQHQLRQQHHQYQLQQRNKAPQVADALWSDIRAQMQPVLLDIDTQIRRCLCPLLSDRSLHRHRAPLQTRGRRRAPQRHGQLVAHHLG